ncbi:DUF3630 family protein [Aliiglaciecola sp. CAU 1673]|uniref:DUF3630 family protein n=1 Tax=Aliiglaciecola sp. CAU 1673 TaxID=3032595 RepID=UPI0023D9AC3E|nr:DUF3630 family protein [Aliiglaciecola sp. CAU 1673]MDF2177842.1 DUF3630 family protein [Aliiglaciecola sp. CAU 1673]
MQQLVLHESQVQINGDLLMLDCYPLTQSMGLNAFSHLLCETLATRPLELEQGADRQQCHFSFANSRWVLCIEQLCEAVWIEPLGAADLNNLRNTLLGLS